MCPKPPQSCLSFFHVSRALLQHRTYSIALPSKWCYDSSTHILETVDDNLILCLSLHRLLTYLVAHVPILKLLLSIALLAIGMIGCQLTGMWSLRGTYGNSLHARMYIGTIGYTGGIGSGMSIVTILVFLLCPRGLTSFLSSILLTSGLMAFHYTSILLSTGYVANSEGLAWGPVLPKALILIIVSLQMVATIGAAVYFGLLAMRRTEWSREERDTAHQLTQHIAAMELNAAKEMKEQLGADASALELSLFQIVSNLELYRPYLPDSLFAQVVPHPFV